jgi:hypothetical protein
VNKQNKRTEKLQELFLEEILNILNINWITNLNDIYNLFLNKFIYYLENSLPIKTYYKKEATTSRWITKGIKASCHRMRFLNKLKRNLTLVKF